MVLPGNYEKRARQYRLLQARYKRRRISEVNNRTVKQMASWTIFLFGAQAVECDTWRAHIESHGAHVEVTHKNSVRKAALPRYGSKAFFGLPSLSCTDKANRFGMYKEPYDRPVACLPALHEGGEASCYRIGKLQDTCSGVSRYSYAGR